jgi:three-Cys-motif partner protein
MHTKKNVKTNLLDHSEAKVKLLNEYLLRYLSIICNDGYTKEINVYDLFCGEGLYQNGGEGSPLIIMRAINNVLKNTSKHPPKINCLFNDKDQVKVNKVKKAIKAKSLYNKSQGNLNFSSIDYEQCLSKLYSKAQLLKDEKMFIFIDPYGYKNIKTSHIKNLLMGNKAEVLLWLPTQHMYRFDGDGAPTALKDFIEELMPMNKWKSSDNVWAFINTLKTAFQDAVGTNYFVENFTIEKDKNTVFCLFFFTSHIKGFEKMLESKWKIDNDGGKGWSYTANQMSLFSHEKNNLLEENLLKYISEQAVSNFDLYEFTLRQGFLPKHAREVLTSLQKRKLISVDYRSEKKPPRGAFYISYKEYKNRKYNLPKLFIKKA